MTIPVTLWFISKNKKQKGKTLFIDARKMGYMVDRKHRDFTDEDIQKLADTFEAFQNGTLEDVKGFCAVADLQTIEKQDYILTPGRYVGIEEQEEDSEPFDEKMLKEWKLRSTQADRQSRNRLSRSQRKAQPVATESSADDKELLLKLLQNPEMAALLKSLAKTL